MAEGRMNLAALQQRDPYITEIVDTASQVALYSFSAKANEWEKTSIEGSLFLYKRSASPVNGFMILNRLGLNNLIEPITKDLEFQHQDPFLLYRNAKTIYGIWFYDKDECARIGQLMNSFLQLAIESHQKKSQNALRSRRASESDSMQDRVEALFSGTKPVDIMQMLSKAQHEYDKSKVGVPRKTDPKPFIDNPNASAMKSTDLIKPTPLKIDNGANDEGAGTFMIDSSNQNTTPAAPISLESLFRTASIQQQKQKQQTSEIPDVQPSSAVLHRSLSVSDTDRQAKVGQSSKDELPPLLKHIMSSGSMVEEIERQQRGEVPKNVYSNQPVASTSSLHPVSQEMKRTSPSGVKKLKRISPNLSVVSDSSLLPIHDSESTENMTVDLCNLSVSSSQSSHDTSALTRTSPGSNKSNPVARQSSVVDRSSKTLTGSELLTPAALEQSLQQSQMGPDISSGAVVERPASGAMGILNLSAAAASLSTDVLLSPMAFVSGTTTTSPINVTESSPPKSESAPVEQLPVAALTKEQLQQAMLYLIKNDPNFIHTLHEAYLKSLQELARPKT